MKIFIIIATVYVISRIFYSMYRDSKTNHMFKVLGDVSNRLDMFYNNHRNDDVIKTSVDDVAKLAKLLGDIYDSTTNIAIAIPIVGDFMMYGFARTMNITESLLLNYIESVNIREREILEYDNFIDKLYNYVKSKFDNPDDAIDYVLNNVADPIFLGMMDARNKSNVDVKEEDIRELSVKIKESVAKKFKDNDGE